MMSSTITSLICKILTGSQLGFFKLASSSSPISSWPEFPSFSRECVHTHSRSASLLPQEIYTMLVCSDHVCARIFKTWRGLAFLRTFNLKFTIVWVVFLLLWEKYSEKSTQGKKGFALTHSSRQRSSRPHPGKAWQQGWEAGWPHTGIREREQGVGKAVRPQSSSTSESDILAPARSHSLQVPEPSQEGLEIKSSNPWTNEGLSSLKPWQWLTSSLQSPDDVHA